MESASAERTVRRIIDLLDEMLKVIAGENERLKTGLPASLAQSLERKTQLSAEFEAFLLAMHRGEFDVRAATPHSFSEMIERLNAIRPLLDENTSLIRASMRASRRRIDAIMTALRQQNSASRGYGADRRTLRRVEPRGSQVA